MPSNTPILPRRLLAADSPPPGLRGLCASQVERMRKAKGFMALLSDRHLVWALHKLRCAAAAAVPACMSAAMAVPL